MSLLDFQPRGLEPSLNDISRIGRSASKTTLEDLKRRGKNKQVTGVDSCGPYLLRSLNIDVEQHDRSLSDLQHHVLPERPIEIAMDLCMLKELSPSQALFKGRLFHKEVISALDFPSPRRTGGARNTEPDIRQVFLNPTNERALTNP